LEIRDPIHGSIELTPAETAVIDSAFFQRLRNIKQTGFAEFSFPGATHNRYCHSLGAMHLAGTAFDHIFRGFPFTSPAVRWRLRQTVRLASLLHDVGHGPLSHTSEEVMPQLSDLNIKIYGTKEKRRANHEDYTIKIITDSELSPVLDKNFSDLSPKHVALLIDKNLKEDDEFFIDNGINIRPLLSQIVSSELDVDRMDYLTRDSYYCGTSYGHVDYDWLMANLTYYRNEDKLNLAVQRRALYTFDDFLISRYHMYLMVYFHHKSIIYEEMLMRYLSSDDCAFFLPGDIEEYIDCTDYALYQHLGQVDNEWAKRISERRIYRVLFELHSTGETGRPEKIQRVLEDEGISVIPASSSIRLSKYHGGNSIEKNFPIYVVDLYDRLAKPYPIEQSTQIFQKYDEIRRIERLYVPPEQLARAEKILISKKL